MKFTLTVRMDSAAFGEFDIERIAELRRILKEIAHNINSTSAQDHVVRDCNGNTVGKYTVKRKGR